MIKIFKNSEVEGKNILIEMNTIESGCWISLVEPTKDEIDYLISRVDIPMEFIHASLDEEERAHIDSDEGSTLVLIDVPRKTNLENSSVPYETVPLGIIINANNIVTISVKENPIIEDFTIGRVRNFSAGKKTRFLFQILYRNSVYYLQYLRQIDRTSEIIERELHRSMKNKELIQMLGLEKSLVYFSTALKSNEVILERILRTKPIKMYPEDEEILEDVIIENKQAIEMANIYSSILGGTMDAYASVISNNLNIVMKFLASITIVLSIPTIVASFYGMNVDIPMSNYPFAFWIILLFSFLFSGGLGYIMFKKNLF